MLPFLKKFIQYIITMICFYNERNISSGFCDTVSVEITSFFGWSNVYVPLYVSRLMSPKPDIALPNLDLGSYPSRMSFFFCRNFLCLTKIEIKRTFNFFQFSVFFKRMKMLHLRQSSKIYMHVQRKMPETKICLACNKISCTFKVYYII